ncbi:M23 family metallopeptidase [Polaribacter sp. IC073]|uniref:M23 family metallopeptidase n=1 Tax=Polaribacter sp. IC073 TaxID=2508540 RepID=UPI0011BDD831|nr:M23 family metallopeptidase [Polaribacter sp. IC073]TXD49097.1 M23 family metallopeptidase [Polaribacter sp. IC073]
MKQQLLLLLLIPFLSFSQEKYPKDYFQNPLKIPLILSGTFGELRSNHFHSGLDIKTQGRTGLKVVAAAAGYVSRIKVQQYGYGKAIYVTHPNGFTSVYGHLSKFNVEIETYVKNIQYKKENYETGNLFPKKNKFIINKGDLIAFSGDTGGSGGPHLHFEIRDTTTEKVINPMLFGITVPDTKTPTIQSLQVYPLSIDARINQQYNSYKIDVKNLGNGKYSAQRISASGTIGFGINAFDRLNNAWNKNGIYSLEMLVNGKRHYYHDVETFSFAESKYLNLLIDYEYYKNYKSRIQKTFKVPKNKLSIYKDLIDNGKIFIKNGLNYVVEIIAKDFTGNTSSVKISIAGKDSNSIFKKQKDATNYKIIATNFQKFSEENVTVAFPKNTFYENIFLDFKVANGIAKIHTPTIPLDKSYTLTFNVSKYSEEEKEQLYIANIEYEKYPRYVYTRKKDSTFYTTTKTLGKYTLKTDKLKPKASILYIKDKQWISNSKTIKVKISDADSGVKNWRATIDGAWVLMQYNHKKNILTYNFSDKKLVGSKHIFKIVVSDNVGNTTERSITFCKKQAK